MIIHSARFTGGGSKRPQYPLPNPEPSKRANLSASNSASGPAPGSPKNGFTPGGGPVRDKASEALSSSRFDIEFGDDFYGTDLDRIVALTDIALKNSGLEPMIPNSNESPPISSAYRPNNPPPAKLGTGIVPRPNGTFDFPKSMPGYAPNTPAPSMRSVPVVIPRQNQPSANICYGFQDEPALLHQSPSAPSNSMPPDTKAVHGQIAQGHSDFRINPNTSGSGIQNTSVMPFGPTVLPSNPVGMTYAQNALQNGSVCANPNINGSEIPDSTAMPLRSSGLSSAFTHSNVRRTAPSLLEPACGNQQVPILCQDLTSNSTVQASCATLATATQQVLYSNDVAESGPDTALDPKDGYQPHTVSLEEYNRLRVMFNECSQERGKLRLQQKHLQAQIAEKTGALTMLRTKLNSLESQLNKTRAEMAQRAAQKNDAHKAQHERMKAQIDSLNLERESLERELEEIGRTNESLTRALSSERQSVLALKRQLSALSDSNHMSSSDSVEQASQVRSVSKDCSLYAPDNARSKLIKSKNLEYEQNPSDRLIPKIVSSSLESGLLELVSRLDIADLYESLGTGLENQLSLLINGSYPVFYAIPILKPILDSGKAAFMVPVLKVFCILVTYNARSRQIILGSPNVSTSSQSQPSGCFFQNPSSKLVPCPVWPKPGTCLVIPKSSLDNLDSAKYKFKSFYKPIEEESPFEFIECPGIINSLIIVLKTRDTGVIEVIELSLSILLELLRHAQVHQIPKFNGLLDTGLLQSLFFAVNNMACQIIILKIFTHLLWYEDNLKWFTKTSSQPSALECAYTAMGWNADRENQNQATILHLVAMDALGFVLGKYGQRGVNVVLYGYFNSQQRHQSEQQILPKLVAVMMAELDCSQVFCVEKSLQLIFKAISLIETLLPYVDVKLQTAGYKFQFLSVLTRIMQIGDDMLADQASTIRLQLIESGCLDLLSKNPNDSVSSSA